MASTKSRISIVYRTVSELHPYRSNARTHSKRQIRQIADSIKAFGFTNPILIDSKKTIVAGHGRVEAAKLIGIDKVPTIELSSLSDHQIRAYILADNKLAEKAGWDEAILKIELQHLIDLSDQFDITVTGFEIAEIDLILADDNEGDSEEEELPDASSPAVCRLGDVWCLGEHRVMCASALEPASYERLMHGRLGNTVFSDPPYNVAIDGHACGNGSIKHEPFAMACGEMSSEEFTGFLDSCMTHLKANTADGSIHYLCIDWRHMQEMLAAGANHYHQLLNVCVWVKDNGGMGSLYRSRHELVFVYRRGKEIHRNNIQLGRYGRNRTNVWEYPGIGTMSKQSKEGNLLALHPTVKPVKMVADALLDCSAPNEIVLDPFLGSGTTVLAAQKTKRICYGLELDPKYVDVAIRRWERLTGLSATNEQTGQTFANVASSEEVHCG